MQRGLLCFYVPLISVHKVEEKGSYEAVFVIDARPSSFFLA